ncbi:MAG: hypothetical protein RLZZ15_3366 [Verrucomicrobiota bacterium]|jgi:Rrf2 family protein
MTGNTRFAASVHILAYLAHRRGAAVASSEIAASVDTHAVVVRRLLAALVQARLVTATKGAAGGFALARPASKISLRDLYRAVEPRAHRGLDHFVPNPKCPVGAKIGAVLQTVFGRARASLEAELARVSLAAIHRRLRPLCTGRK